MDIHIIAVGDRMPQWVEHGYAEYAKRLPKHCQLKLTEIPLQKRSKHNIQQCIAKESAAMLAAITKQSHVIALEVTGKAWTTQQLSQHIESWQAEQSEVSLLVGGPEGLSDECLARAKQQWSLSNLTLPHPVVRVVLAEALYRAWSLSVGHPYHR